MRLSTMLRDPRLLAALFLKGDAKAIAHVLDTLRACGGNVEKTAERLQVGAKTLYRWRDKLGEEHRKVFDETALGREGGAKRGREARATLKRKRAERKSKKSAEKQRA